MSRNRSGIIPAPDPAFVQIVRFILACLTALFAVAAIDANAAEDRPPNILVVLADDMGFSDAGCYGGEIATPNLNRLADGGLKFTQFYNTARCWPSRGAILTGYYAQQIRRDTVPGIESGSRGVRPGWAKLLPEMLKPLGYRSYHSGKWHVDGPALAAGFDRSYMLNDQNRFFSPRQHLEDDQPLPPVEPDTGYYATVAIADHAVRCLKDHAGQHAGKPFFHYLCFTSPHFPLHALPEDIARYRGKYRQGWDVLRDARWRRMKELGIVNCNLSARPAEVPAWDSLSSDQQDQWEVRMAIHAAMIDRMDREIGRVLDQLQAMGVMDNTVIFFLSDNGASAESIVRGDGHDPAAPPGSWKTHLCIETPWAGLANTPLRRSKIFVHEGGISTPMIVHWPKGVSARGELRHNPGHVIDIAPTVLELAGGKRPEIWNNEPVPAPPGKSLVPAFSQDGAVQHDYYWWFHSGNRAIRRGDWKLVAAGEEPWELYNLSSDRCESNNLATQHPDKVRDLETEWAQHLEEFRLLAAKDLPENSGEQPKRAKRAKKGQ